MQRQFDDLLLGSIELSGVDESQNASVKRPLISRMRSSYCPVGSVRFESSWTAM